VKQDIDLEKELEKKIKNLNKIRNNSLSKIEIKDEFNHEHIIMNNFNLESKEMK